MKKLNIPISNTSLYAILLFCLSTALVLIGNIVFAHTTNAANAHDFRAGNIIDDYTFTNNSSMSAQQIQNFLNEKNSVCLKDYRGLALVDTNGNGHVEDLTQQEQYGGPTGTATMSAAELIKAASDIYGINPQVLLVTLQKEQGLVTRADCPDWRYNTAFGFGCPDTAPCDQAAYGFVRQVDNAAYHFKGFFNNSLTYVPYRPGLNNIYWSPNLSCGTSQVNIENRATASLYSYTPYRPNQAAINAQYGTGDLCSAHGNRNFFLYFTDWFGSTYSNQLILQNVILDQSLQITPDTGNNSNQSYTATFRIRNNSNSTINLGYMFVSARDIYGNNLDFPAKDIIIAPNSTYTYTASRTFPLVGKINAYIGGNLNQIGWTYDVPYAESDSVTRKVTLQSGTSTSSLINDKVKLVQSLRITPTSSVDPNQIYTATFTIRNTSDTKIDLGFMFVSVRDENNSNFDFPVRNIVLNPNETYTYSSSRTFPKVGKLNTSIGGFFNQIGWSYNTPLSASVSIIRERSIIPKSDVVLAGDGISVTHVSGNTYRAKATIKNTTNSTRNIGWYLISARTPTGQNVDFPVQNIILPPHGSVTYDQTRAFDLNEKGRFTYFSNLNDPIDGYGWTQTYPASELLPAKREGSFLNGPNVVQTKEIETFTLADGTIRATVEYTNYGREPEYMGWVILSTRLNGNSTNYDFEPQEVTIKAGERKTLTFNKRFIKGGDYSTTPVFYKWPNNWSSTYGPVQTPSMERAKKFSSTFSAEQVGDTTFTRNGNNTTASITIRNTTNRWLELGSLVVSVRDANQNNVDFPIKWATLAPNETKTFTTTRQLVPGTYHITLTANHYNHGWGPTFKVNTNRNYTF